ncbi:MAG: hypothetical protein ACKO3A_06935 [Opitutia bacterium]
MPRALRLTLWSVGLLALLLGGALFWVDGQLRAEALGGRVKTLLADAKIQGGVAKIEAELDGRFTAEGIDLTLPDGLQFKAASLTGDLGIFASLFGTYTLEKFEAKGLELDLSHRKAAPTSEAPAAPAGRTTLPRVVLGPYSAAGRVTLADGTLLRFRIAGEGVDTAGKVDLRAGVAWPGFAVGTNLTQPQTDIILAATLRETFGGQGLGPDALAAAVGEATLTVIAKDTSPLAAGSMSLELQARHGALAGLDFGGQFKPVVPEGLIVQGTLSDAARRPAAKLQLAVAGETAAVAATLDVDPTKFGILSQTLPDCQVKGRVYAELAAAAGTWRATSWPAQPLQASWADLARFSKAIPKGKGSAWTLAFGIEQRADSLVLDTLKVGGDGIELTSEQPILIPRGKLPQDVALRLKASDADLVTLAPFLAGADLAITAGRWTGEATITLAKGQPAIDTVKTHAIRGLDVERAGRTILRGIDADIPLQAANGALRLAPFKVAAEAGTLASGELIFRPGADGAWSATADVDLGIAELAAQPGWEDLPRDKLAGIRVAAQAALSQAAGDKPTLTATTAKIARGGADLLKVKLRQPLVLGGAKPTGVVLEAAAANLPLESVAALVPGLKLSGTLERADLVVGYRTEGLFVRTEGAPLAFVGTSVSWAGKEWVKGCDLAASLDLLVAEKATVLGFRQARFTRQGRVLAAGDLSLGLGEAPTTLKLAGSLGALAAQPFAGPLGVIATGDYQAAATRAADGSITVSLDVSEVTTTNGTGQIKAAEVRGKYVPEGAGLSAEGQIRLRCGNLTTGSFTLTQRVTGTRTDWQGKVRFDNLDGDDVLGLLPRAAEDKPVAATKPRPDTKPLWADQTGAAELRIAQASFKGLVTRDFLLQATVEDQAVKITKLGGTFAEGTLGGGAKLEFKPGTVGGPYVLDGAVVLNGFELGAVADTIPAIREFAQEFIRGKAATKAKVTGVAGTLGELAGVVTIDAELNSGGGRLRSFGDTNRGAALTAGAVSDVGETLGGLAIIAGALSKNQRQGEQIAKVGAAVSAVSKLQKALADFRYDRLELKASRLATGTLKLTNFELRNADLSIAAQGGIQLRDGVAFADWPMLFDAKLRGAGEFATYFNLLGFGSGLPEADGLTAGPAFQVTGSLNSIHSDVMEKLPAAVERYKSGANYQPGNPTQGTAPATPKRNPLEGLLKELGR